MTNGKPTGDKGKFVEIVKKQADGSWKCINDIWNSDHCLHPLLRNDNRGGSSSPPLFKLNTLHCGTRSAALTECLSSSTSSATRRSRGRRRRLGSRCRRSS